MEYITKKDLIDCSTPDEICFSLCCMECKTVWKSTSIRFSRAGKKPENENRKIIYDTLYAREKELAFQKAVMIWICVCNVLQSLMKEALL